MALTSSGKISIAGSTSSESIALEFDRGATSTLSLGDLYRGGAIVPNSPFNSNIPASGPISLFNFYGSSKAQLNTLVFTSSQSWTAPSSLTGSLIVVCVGGGGSGSGPGGGSGGIGYHNSFSVAPGDVCSVIVGGGGARPSRSTTTAYYQGTGAPGFSLPNFDEDGNIIGYIWYITVYQGGGAGGPGGDSSFGSPSAGTVTGYGGGAGGGNSGGSGGGGDPYNGLGGTATQGSGGTQYYGNAGGRGSGGGGANDQSGGGGGGAGSVGGDGLTYGSYGVGGDGVTLFGRVLAGGGGGGGYRSLGGRPFPGSGSLGGSGVGGKAGYLAGDRVGGVDNNGYLDAESGAINTGSGGGGATNGEIKMGEGAGTLAGNGGSGIVIIQGYW